jgi:serine/threonine protein kinase
VLLLLDFCRRLTTKDIPLIFSKCVLAKKKALKWGQFQEAVRNMAVKKGQTYQELVQDALGKTLTGGETDSVEIDEGMQSVAKQFTHNQDGTPLVPDSFDILKVLGTGSYGKVQLVKKKDTGTLHAMKSLKKGDLWKMKQMPHTQTECKVAMGLRHPCLVNLTYAFQTPVKLYLILDLMDGASLAARTPTPAATNPVLCAYAGGEMFYWLRKAKPNFFNPARATLYAAECLLGIEFLHSHNVIYRDLKPENVMIDGGGHARLTDFGLAKEEVSGNVPGDAGLTKSLVGTPEYNAPEQLTGGKNGGQHGKAVDWWSLGMLMYEMTVGQPAYSVSNNNMNQLMKMIKTKVRTSRG